MEVEIKEQCASSTNGLPTLNVTTTTPKIPGVIARLTSNMAEDVHALTFQRHKLLNCGGGYVYTAKNLGPSSEKVVRLGREENSEIEGCDYVVAIMNRRTKQVHCLPTKLICFENVTASDFEAVFDTSQREKIDYSADNTITKDSWAEKRRALTDEFGSAKRMKVQNAAKRRQIKEETLSIMMSSAFSSACIKNEEEVEGEQKTDIPMLMKTESSVLPTANMDANLPRDVYSLSNFLSDAEVVTFKSEAYDRLNTSRKELIAQGFSPLVCDLMGDISGNIERACYILLLDAMMRCYKILAKRRFLAETEWMELHYPVTVLSKIREMFLPGDFVKENARSRRRKLAVNIIDKDRLLAHVLCLAIILDHESTCLPITPWAKELAVAEPKITKIATALGCNVNAATVAEGIRLNTTRVARLVGPPKSTKTRFSGRAAGGRF